MFCALFGNLDVQGQLATKPLTDMAHAHLRLSQHFGQEGKDAKKVHVQSKEKALDFLTAMEGSRQDVQQQLKSALAEKNAKNKKVLESIVKCVLFCGRQNVALRGHRDDSKHLDTKRNCGNFQALIDFRIDAHDENLQEHFARAGKNCTYRSKTIQNEVIAVIKDFIVQQLSTAIKSAGGLFSISADEKSDQANEEQLAICLRFVGRFTSLADNYLTWTIVIYLSLFTFQILRTTSGKYLWDLSMLPGKPPARVLPKHC